MSHAEAEEQCSESLMLMFEHIRQQTDQIEEMLGIEERKSSITHGRSNTKRSTYQPSETMSMYGGVASSVMSSRQETQSKIA